MKGYFHRVHEMTKTRAWINNPTQEEAKLAMEAGMSNCTTNPAFAMKQIQREPQLIHPIIDAVCSREKDDNRAAALIQRECVRYILREFENLFDPETSMSGFVSLQGDPILEDDAQEIISEALECRSLGPNYLAKIPATHAGLRAMEVLFKENIPVIATEVMSLSQAKSVCDLYNRVCIVDKPPLFVTHITGIFDDYIKKVVRENNIDISPDISFQAGTAVARKLYQLYQKRNYPGVILGGGARDLHHFTEFIGGEMHITINWPGLAQTLIEQDNMVVERIHNPVSDYVIEELIEKIPDFSLAWDENALSEEEFASYGPVVLFRDAFVEGWKYLLDEIRKRR